MNTVKIATLIAMCLSSSVVFGATTTQEIAAECTTKGTNLNGTRESCDSEITRITAPENHVFSEKTLQGGETAGRGSEHECRLGWENYVEVVPGSEIYQPRTMTLQAHARSPRHHIGSRGLAKCRYTVKVTKYK
jgi:hypothetical protein